MIPTDEHTVVHPTRGNMNHSRVAGSPMALAVAVWLSAAAFPSHCAAAAPDAPAVPGYIRELPPESAPEREARHRAVAERRGQPAMVILHRGASRFGPENTLEAYAAAMDRGADGCEFDIRRSKDGVLYLHHDDDLGRVVQGDGPVSALTYYELLRRPLKAPYGSADDTTRPPTLAAFLALARQRAMLLHLDIKEPGLEDDINSLLDAA